MVEVVAARRASTEPRPRGRGVRVRPFIGVRRLLASTEPRPRGRGVSSGWHQRFVTPPSLQRSRARAGAEWADHVAVKLGGILLQRSRARAGAECDSILDACLLQLYASTEPRPRGRGVTS